MKKIEFEIEINAKADKVWFALWDDIHYRIWVSPFCKGAYAITDWKEGSKIHFLDPNGSGMFSEITKGQPYEKMYFTHIGEIKNFIEQPQDEISSEWYGAVEHYDLIEQNGVTTLKASVDITEDHFAFFNEAFPKGLDIVKELAENLNITVDTIVNAPIEKIWDYWTNPKHIVNWNHASEDWCTTKAENNLSIGGSFVYTMASKDGNVSFDFLGTYNDIIQNELIDSLLGDGRKMKVEFKDLDGKVKIIETFDAENVFPPEFQKMGWQSILNNFKSYVESAN